MGCRNTPIGTGILSRGGINARAQCRTFSAAGPHRAADAIDYRVRYAATTPELVTVALRPAAPLIAPLPLIMPRTYPGGYAQIPYDDFVSQVVAKGADGKVAGGGTRSGWSALDAGEAGDAVASVEYTVDIARMESAVQDAVATSKHRSGYLALLAIRSSPTSRVARIARFICKSTRRRVAGALHVGAQAAGAVGR